MWFVDPSGVAEEVAIYKHGADDWSVSIDFFLDAFNGGGSAEVADFVCFLSFALVVTVGNFVILRRVRETSIFYDSDFLDVIPHEVDVSSVTLIVFGVTRQNILRAKADDLVPIARDTEPLAEYAGSCQGISSCTVALGDYGFYAGGPGFA